MNIFQRLINRLLFRKTRANRQCEQLRLCIEGRAMDKFLTVLLKLMRLVLCIDPNFRLNIRDFNASYVFKDKSGEAYVVAVFSNNKLRVRQRKAENPDFTLIFSDGRSLFKLLLSESPDVLDAVLNQEVDFSGSVNYLNKFAYMAMHLRLTATKQL